MLQSRQPAARPSLVVRKKPLRLLVKLWAGAHSGQLHLESGEIALIHEGEPRSAEDLRICTRALRAGLSSRFVRRPSSGPPAVPVLARTLWKAACSVADKVALPSTGSLQPRHGFDRLSAFPLDPATRRFLQQEPAIDALIRCAPGDRERIREDLQVLLALGVFKVPAALVEPQELQRLQAEVRRLKGADCWTVLGTADLGEVDRFARRLVNRYRTLVDHADPRMSSLAGALLKQVHRAREEARRGPSHSGGIDEHNAFSVGREELEAGHFSNAVRAFAVLKQAQPFNARAVAWLGYALTHDPSFPEGQRRSRGRRFLEQADSMGSHGGDADLLLARLDIDEGQLVRAWTRLDAAHGRFPSNAEVAALLIQVRKDVRPA